ncbi:MAG: hypothetical protein EHM47_15420 [Ignavibacteriales bacterium]|nr:MAG: hypothetical protein EHM47_15420 [Ignavibacteriales bacterium]
MQVVERLEVIKGPSSLIYGTSGISYGGLLNIVTKKPFKKKFFDAGLTFGSYNLQRFTGDINIPFNDDNTMLFRLNVVAHSEGSFQDYGFKRSYLLAPSFYYKINNNTEFFFDAELNNSKFSSPTWFIGVGALNVNQIDEIKVDYFKSYVSRDLDFEPTQLNNYYGRLNYSVSEDWKLSANVALADINLNGSNMVPLFLNDSLMVRRLFDYNGQYNTLNLHPFITGDFLIGNFRNRMIFGIDYKWAQIHLSRFYNLNIDTINYTQDNFPLLNLNQIRMNYSTSFIEKATANNVALYVSDFFSFNEQLNLMI